MNLTSYQLIVKDRILYLTYHHLKKLNILKNKPKLPFKSGLVSTGLTLGNGGIGKEGITECTVFWTERV